MADEEKPAILPARTFTLRELTAALASADEDLAFGDFDPEQVVGEIKEKVDAIKAVLDRMEVVSGWLDEQAKPLLKQARTLGKNAERLHKYVAEQMRANGFDSLPGNVWKVRLKENQPSLIVEREPTALDFQKWPNLVKMQRYYEWDNAALKQFILDADPDTEWGAKLLNDLPARVIRKLKIEFRANIPEQLEPKKRGKKN